MFYVVYILTVLCASTAYGNGADERTSGFMSLDRMDIILENEGDIPYNHNYHGIFPEVVFTCSGTIQSWIFGALWEGNIDSSIELQIWRPASGTDELYNLVENTTIFIIEENETQLYHYPLSSPLSFQPGDILGIFQPPQFNSQLILAFELNEEVQQQLGYFDTPNRPFSSLSQFNISEYPSSRSWNMLVNVITDPPDCGCGFMSVERMKLLLDIDDTEGYILTERRQQITPDIRFTCDGMITKWIIAGTWDDDEMLYPELQIWRNIGNDTYQKINGTFIEPPAENTNRIYEYDNFTPIPFQSGDILGIYIPQTGKSGLGVLSENVNTPNNYHLPTNGTNSVSPYNMIDIQNNPSISSQRYHPMVTVEIVKGIIPTSSAIPVIPTHSSDTTSTPTSSAKAIPTDGSSTERNVLYISVGVGGSVIILIVAAITITTTVIIKFCMRKRVDKILVNTADNDAYGMNPGLELSDNVAYTTTTTNTVDKTGNYDYAYEYVSTAENNNDIIVSVNPNEAYGISINRIVQK